MPAPEAIHKLVEHFSTHIEHYKSSGYNETELRREYLDPFWKALGWDIDNEQGYADAYKDVIHEDAIKVGGYTKAPDYCFRIGGTRKFFVEAKKPSVIPHPPSPACSKGCMNSLSMPSQRRPVQKISFPCFCKTI